MPSKNPRIALTLEPHRYELLTRLAKHQGKSRAAVITETLELIYPVMERVCVVLEAAQLAQESSREGLRQSVAKAEAELLPQLYRAVDQFDMFVEDAAASIGLPLDASEKASKVIRQAMADEGPARSAHAPARRVEASSGPRPVIRGSGSSKKGG